MLELQRFSTIEQIKEASKKGDHVFFDPKDMKFWGSRISENVYGGCVFVTSEHNYNRTRRHYYVRAMQRTGYVLKISEGFDTLQQAKTAAKYVGENIWKYASDSLGYRLLFECLHQADVMGTPDEVIFHYSDLFDDYLLSRYDSFESKIRYRLGDEFGIVPHMAYYVDDYFSNDKRIIFFNLRQNPEYQEPRPVFDLCKWLIDLYPPEISRNTLDEENPVCLNFSMESIMRVIPENLLDTEEDWGQIVEDCIEAYNDFVREPFGFYITQAPHDPGCYILEKIDDEDNND
jgi:hypothetical protein